MNSDVTSQLTIVAEASAAVITLVLLGSHFLICSSHCRHCELQLLQLMNTADHVRHVVREDATHCYGQRMKRRWWWQRWRNKQWTMIQRLSLWENNSWSCCILVVVELLWSWWSWFIFTHNNLLVLTVMICVPGTEYWLWCSLITHDCLQH